MTGAVQQLLTSDPSAVASLADRTYLRLREELIRAELAPGTLLREEDLMQRLGVGRTPVREALLLLEREGFVTVIPRRGTLVTEINILDLATIYEVRAHNEAWAARLAAERANDDDIREAQALLAELRAVTKGDPEMLLELDRRIHRFAYRCAKNDQLATNLDHYHHLSLRILRRHEALPESRPQPRSGRRRPAEAPRRDLQPRRRHRRGSRAQTRSRLRARDPRRHLGTGAPQP